MPAKAGIPLPGGGGDRAIELRDAARKATAPTTGQGEDGEKWKMAAAAALRGFLVALFDEPLEQHLEHLKSLH